MKKILVRSILCFALFMTLVGLPGRVFAEDADLMRQAEKLVHQAWNPGDTAPTNEERSGLLTQAIEVARNAPQHHVHRHRVHAIELMRAALEEIKQGDPNNKVSGLLHDADSELREAISETE